MRKWPDDFINKIICGDCLEVMREMPSKSIDMCLTSPPYWGLRDYGTEQIFGGDKDCEHEWGDKIIQKQRGAAAGESAQVGNQKNKIQGTHINQGNFCLLCHAWKGQLGLESTPEMYIEHMTEIFHEVKRVLKKEGTLWLNVGDTYGGSCQGGGDTGLSKERYRKELLTYTDKPQKKMMPKCMLMIPERLAWSLIQDGWILRNKIIWYKPNGMPSSVKDRFTNKWEYIFLFSKSRKYYFDLDAIREPCSDQERLQRPFINPKNLRKRKWSDKYAPPINPKTMEASRLLLLEKGKNPGDVFEIPAETRTMGAIIGSSGAVKVPGGQGWTGHPKGGGNACQKDPRWCPPEGPNPGDFWQISTQPFPEAHFAVFPEKLCEKPIKAGCPEEGILLDLFCGAGTALFVAKEMRRKFIGIDIKQEYCDMSKKRLAQGVL